VRKESVVVIDAPGRDQGKKFRLTEMPASRAEAWATRLLLCLAKSGVDLPPNIGDLGMAGVAFVGVRALAGVSWADAKPLLDEMFECVTALPDPNHPSVFRPLVENDIEEVTTRLRLRDEVLILHTGFSVAASFSSLRGNGSAATVDPIATGQDIPTSLAH
jgi:hypothetical protein